MNQEVHALKEQINRLKKELENTPPNSPKRKELRDQISKLDNQKEQLEMQKEQQNEFCFVIMPLSGELEELYKYGVKAGVESRNMNCILAEKIADDTNSLCHIVKRIYTAKVVIADVTNKTPDIFYELGLAHGLDKNVIMLTQTSKDELPCGLDNYSVIQYTTKVGADRKLKDEIEKAIITIDTSPNQPHNSIQHCLPPDERPVPGSHHKTISQTLKNVQQELGDLREIEQSSKVQEKEFELLRERYETCQQTSRTVQKNLQDMQLRENTYKTQEQELNSLQKEHNKLEQELINTRQELKDARDKLGRYKDYDAELQQLRGENSQFRVIRKFMQAISQGSSGKLDEGVSDGEMLKQFFARIDKEGEVTVSMPQSQGDKTVGAPKEKKITFRPVKKDQN